MEVAHVGDDEAGGTETVERITAMGSKAALVTADVSRADGATRAVEGTVERFGHLDILVNNAGIVQGTARDTWDCDEDVWDRILRVNLKSVYLCTRAAVPKMTERGGGSIVNTASIAASVCVGGSAYAASKGGMLSYTRHTARELASRERKGARTSQSRNGQSRKIYIMDEPTTGLHIDDIRKLAGVLDRLLDAGHTLVVIEHNLDVIKLADWIIDLGPEAGDAGGEVVAMGRPEDVARNRRSLTGQWLAPLLQTQELTISGIGSADRAKAFARGERRGIAEERGENHG